MLVSPGGFTPHNLITRLFCKLQGSRFSLSPNKWARLYLKVKTPTTKAMLKRAATAQSSPEVVSLNRALWRRFVSPENNLKEAATHITAPTLLIFGQYDPAIPAKKDGIVAHRCIGNSKLVVLPCGHAAFAELPEEFLAEITNALSL